MAWIVERKNKKNSTFYICYRDGTNKVRKIMIGRSRSHAEKELKKLEAKLSLGISDIEKKDYPIDKFFQEYLQRTEHRHSESYHKRNSQVINHFKKFIEEAKPHLTRLSNLTANAG